MAIRPCMLCNEPLDGDICHTPGCAYNPEGEMEVHEAEWKFDESLHQNPEETDEEIPHNLGQPDPNFQNLPDSDLLEGDFEDEGEHEFDPEAEQKDASDEADTLDISQENLPDQSEAEQPSDEPDDYVDADQPFDDDEPTDTDESTDEPESLSDESESEADSAESEQAPNEEGTGDLDEMTDEQKDKLNQERMEDNEKQLTEEDKGEDPSDDAHDLPEGEQDEDDPDLPPKPRGCTGNCQPGDLDEEGDPCPHCTAKAFKEEMEGKQQAPEQMEQDWQNFLDDWQNQADKEGNGQGDQGDEQMEAPPEEKSDREQRMENRTPPDLGGEDDDLPQKPPGCSGDCQPMEQYDPDADPCPHCTAKQFRDEMRDQEDQGQEDLTPDELGEKFQDFLRNWADQQEKGKEKDEPEEEQNPDEIDEAPPEDEMQDGEQKEIEIEEDTGEFERLAKKMTVTQEKRFDNIVDRIEKKVEQTFGQTAEDIFTMKKQEGQFAGEEISQSIQITSRGVTYWVTISAAKEI